MYLLLRDEKIEEFNALHKEGEKCDLAGLDFRGLDLRGIETDVIDFSNAYFRQANLAGLNLTSCNLEGASIGGANISGTYFPKELSSDEIMMSLNTGTRMRYGT
ncbi:MAG: pentapeptide repeat-containing protein [Fidelibacterota bacterium]|nr:MAG: pentapeptide repeat-containing protein [Candidatus Neomarinimicrobiota bacterium]